ncbi:MAG: hypothetical protein DCF19_14590 [Pseudanabaena frigida]|uniref:Uncharacterized protein n=1 Tax=Pseudanabaena frigida TaxID=945775 RepID=A0A2W4Y7H2_9CYAN|nr:MAG: hypothetical protein DCF19_14590 [Pseudanabaena frigida]
MRGNAVTNKSVALQQGDLSEYVTHLQLHMALQARNLVPNLSSDRTQDSRSKMLSSTQADFERLASRL